MDATGFRTIGLAATVLSFFVVVLIFKPEKNERKYALIAGVVCALYDFTIEAIAKQVGAWFCYGGLQFLGLGVPLDMLVGFVFYGASVSIISDYPKLFRKWHLPTLNEKYDWIGAAVLVMILSPLGAYGDFQSMNFGAWAPVSYWTFAHTTFAWFTLLVITLLSYQVMKRMDRKNHSGGNK